MGLPLALAAASQAPSIFNIAAGQAAGTAAGEGARGIMGLVFGGVYNKRQVKQQRRMNELQKEMTDYNMEKQLEMWEKTGYGATKQQMKEAGLNPALMYGMGGGGGSQTASIAQGQAQQAMSYEAAGMGMNLELLKSQINLQNAQAEKVKVEAEKIGGVDTENVKADTQNKVLQQVVTEYTGKEAKDVYERIKSPNRGIEAKTYQDEMEARQGFAGTVYELWTEGKLKEKSISEIEAIALQNAKTREEIRNIYKTGELLEQNIKGAKLENIIKDLETRLQTQTGIDKNAETWIKVLGRLFVELTEPKK